MSLAQYRIRLFFIDFVVTNISLYRFSVYTRWNLYPNLSYVYCGSVMICVLNAVAASEMIDSRDIGNTLFQMAEYRGKF